MNVRLSWSLPAVSSRQRPITRVDLYSRVSPSLPFAPIGSRVPSETQDFLIESVDPGDWEYGARVIDVGGAAGGMATTSTSVDFDAPSMVGGLTATKE